MLAFVASPNNEPWKSINGKKGKNAIGILSVFGRVGIS